LNSEKIVFNEYKRHIYFIKLEINMSTNPVNQYLSPDQYQKWFIGLQHYLYNDILPLAEPDPTRRLKLVDQEPMLLWAKTFTHETYNPNLGQNYEELEKLGDAVMKTIFIKYLMIRFANINRAILSELSNHYLSKEKQAQIALNLGLDKWILILVDKNTHIFEDLLESLFGALLQIGDLVFKVGGGYVLCYNLLVSIYNSIDIDLSFAKGRSKTQVKQTFEKMSWPSLKELWDANADATSGILYLKMDHCVLSSLANYGINFPNDILASAEGSTKKVATNNAYIIALNRLTELGITQEWADLQREQNEFMVPELAPYYQGALSRIQRDGYIDMFFRLPRKGTGGCYVQLIGVDKNDNLVVLKTVVDNKIITAKQKALDQYAKGI